MSDLWKMSIYYKKCKILHFGANNTKINYAMNHKDTQVYIDTCSSVCDLDVILDPNRLFDNHLDKALKKANQTFGSIKKHLHSKIKTF